MTKAKIIENAVRRAQEEASKTGFMPGQVVAHPSDEFTYYLREADGAEGVVYLPKSKSPTSQEVIKRFPLGELFDPNRARDLVIEVRNKSFQGKDEGYFVVDL